MLNKETALLFNNDVCDGFLQPTLAWSATTPYHINATGGSGMTSNFWVCSSKDVKDFAEKMAEFYRGFYDNAENFESELDEHESISVAYWEKDGIAMCADLCTSDQIYDMLPEELVDSASNLKMVLFSGNDNHPGLILQNDEVHLSVEERILLASFMGYEPTAWVLEEEYREEYLPDFSDDEVERLKVALKK